MKIINLGNRAVNNYIVSIDDKYVLIDTGYENGFVHFYRRLHKNKIDLESISYVFLTHAHDDHAGFLNELLNHSSAKVILHPRAIERLRYGQNSFSGACSSKTALLFCKAMYLAGKGEHRFPPIEKKFEERYILFGSDTAKNITYKFSMKIIETPGHTPCSISLLLRNGILFCGDAAMNGFPSSKRTTIWIEDMSRFYASWKTILSLAPQKIYPGHGKPFSPSDLNIYLECGKMHKSYPL